MYRVMWRLISVLFGLTGFGIICLVCTLSGEDLLTTVMKAVGAFMVLWFFFSLMGVIFSKVVPTGDEQDQIGTEYTPEVPGDRFERAVHQQIPAVSDDFLPSIELGVEAGSGSGRAA